MPIPAGSALIILLAAALLTGCEMITGEKAKDGESIGYACRLSSKLPEDCMKENDAYSPTSILSGWKAGDKDIKMGTRQEKGTEPAENATPAEGEAAPEGGAPQAEAQPATPEPEKH